MPAVRIPTPTASQPLADQVTTIDGREYRLKYDWNSRANYWMFSIETTQGERILTGQPIVGNWDLIRSVKHALAPRGVIFARTRDGRTPGLEELSSLAKLIHAMPISSVLTGAQVTTTPIAPPQY